MNEQELNQEVREMTETGMIQHLTSGDQAIAVSFATRELLPAISRQERKEILYQQFYRKLNDLIGKGLEVDYTSISISAQTVEGKLSLKSINPWMLNSLRERNLSLYTNRNRQVV